MPATPVKRHVLLGDIRLFANNKKHPLTARLQDRCNCWGLFPYITRGLSPRLFAKRPPACKFPHYSGLYVYAVLFYPRTSSPTPSHPLFFIIPHDVPEEEQWFRQFSFRETSTKQVVTHTVTKPSRFHFGGWGSKGRGKNVRRCLRGISKPRVICGDPPCCVTLAARTRLRGRPMALLFTNEGGRSTSAIWADIKGWNLYSLFRSSVDTWEC